jgi:hypothetical protein
MILASCFNLGIQRYDNDGHNEGSYHVGGTAIHAVPDFPGRLIAVATQEGEIALLNRGGNVRWKNAIGRAPVALEIDALGRYLIYGLDTGEICKLDLEGQAKPRAEREPSAALAGAGTLRRPQWSVDLARTEEEGQAAVLAVLDDPPRVAAILRNNRLQVFDNSGELVHSPTEILGIGRILRTTPGWIAAATDRQILLHNARTGDSKRVEIDLHELTHLVIRPDGYGLAIVQEGDLAGRATPAGRWVWKKNLRMQIEEIATGPMGLTALACDDGSLLVLDAAGEAAGRYTPDPPEPLLLIECVPEANPARAAWITLARRAQVLRAHAPDGSVLWESPTPFEGWRLASVAGMACITAPDGRVLIYDQAGYLVSQAGAEAAPFVLAPGPKNSVVRLIQRDLHLICSALDGTVLWRSIGDSPAGPTTGGRSGIATMIGRELAWFAGTK